MFFTKVNKKSLSLMLSATLSILVLNSFTLVKAETKPNKDKCEYFKEITTDQTEIRKQIQDRVLLKNNWNTDFAVPASMKYDFYVGNMTPENTDNYQVSINLKYPDGSFETVYSRDVPMQKGKPYSLTFKTATGKQPYQINALIGGSNNNAYTISVLGCQ